MENQTVYPRAKNGGKIPIWRAVGGTPQSVLSAENRNAFDCSHYWWNADPV